MTEKLKDFLEDYFYVDTWIDFVASLAKFAFGLVLLVVLGPFILAYGLCWDWPRAAIFWLRDLRDEAAANKIPEVKFAGDSLCLLEYEVMPVWESGARSAWKPWRKAEGGKAKRNVSLVHDFILASKFSTHPARRLVGIKIRNATGSGRRTKRHQAGIMADADIINEAHAVLDLPKHYTRPRDGRLLRGDKHLHGESAAYSRVQCKRNKNRFAEAFNALAAAVDAVIHEYESGGAK